MAMRFLALAERLIEASVVLRSDAEDEENGQKRQENESDRKKYTKNQMGDFERHLKAFEANQIAKI